MRSHYGRLIESLYPRVIGASLNKSVFCYKGAHFSASRTSVLWLVQHLYFLKTLFGLCTCLYVLCTCTCAACLCREPSTAASRFIPMSLMITRCWTYIFAVSSSGWHSSVSLFLSSLRLYLAQILIRPHEVTENGVWRKRQPVSNALVIDPCFNPGFFVLGRSLQSTNV